MKPRLAAAPLLLIGLAVLPLAEAARDTAPPAGYHVYFGTYTKGGSQGIYRARLDVKTGTLSAAVPAAAARDPSFLAVHPRGEVLYAVEESTDPVKTPGRGVSAFALDRNSGELTLLNQQTAGGNGPCHLATDREGACLIVANYGSGSIEAIKLLRDGRLGDVGTFIQHTGSSVHPRQKGPHAHGIALSPDNRFALVADLGLDRVLLYRLQAGAAKLESHRGAFVALAPGSGPRHLAFDPSGRSVYVINEILCTISACRYDPQAGSLTEVQVMSTLPEGESVKPGYSTAEIAVHPTGRFVFGSNRGHDSIAVFARDGTTGRLTSVSHHATGGKTPRHFAIDPTGTWLLAENQASNSVTVFRIDTATGKLTATGASIEVPSPVCAVFVPAPR
ncbi:MAG: lactonase family protein [Opitutaceae bacterium]|nr:lactonase family protein [Opitutaceae bacterium]